jgi:hypothetical protein
LALIKTTATSIARVQIALSIPLKGAGTVIFAPGKSKKTRRRRSALTDNPLQVLPAHRGSNPIQSFFARIKKPDIAAVGQYQVLPARSNNPFKTF